MNTEKQNVPSNNPNDPNGNANQSSQQSDVFANLDQFAAHVAKWHKIGMLQTQHMVNMPEGFEAKYEEEDGTVTTIELKGDTLKAFRMGLLTGMDAFRTLPFTYSVEDADGPAEKSE